MSNDRLNGNCAPLALYEPVTVNFFVICCVVIALIMSLTIPIGSIRKYIGTFVSAFAGIVKAVKLEMLPTRLVSV